MSKLSIATASLALLASAHWVAAASAIEEVVVTGHRATPITSADVTEVVVTARRYSHNDSPWFASASRFNLDPLDLYSIALQETRRHFPDGQLRPWPWTLHTASEGALYFDTYEEALTKLRQLITKGVKNIDIGVMQVNWGWNGHRYPDPAKLLLPQNNIDVAAEILRENLDECGGDLHKAIARYHSRRAENALPYAAAVMTIRRELDRFSNVKLALAL